MPPAHPLVFYLFIFSSCMCIPFHCVQSTFFFQMTRLRRKRKDDAEQEANYKRIKITEKHKQGPGLWRQKKKEKCVCVYVCICICVCVRAPKIQPTGNPLSMLSHNLSSVLHLLLRNMQIFIQHLRPQIKSSLRLPRAGKSGYGLKLNRKLKMWMCLLLVLWIRLHGLCLVKGGRDGIGWRFSEGKTSLKQNWG